MRSKAKAAAPPALTTTNPYAAIVTTTAAPPATTTAQPCGPGAWFCWVPPLVVGVGAAIGVGVGVSNHKELPLCGTVAPTPENPCATERKYDEWNIANGGATWAFPVLLACAVFMMIGFTAYRVWKKKRATPTLAGYAMPSETEAEQEPSMEQALTE